MATHSSTLDWRIPRVEEPDRLQSMGSLRVGLSDFTFTFHFHVLEKERATHSSVLAWKIPWTEEPGGLQSMGLHRVRHDWCDLAAAAAKPESKPFLVTGGPTSTLEHLPKFLLTKFSRFKADHFFPHLYYLQWCFSELHQKLHPHLSLPAVWIFLAIIWFLVVSALGVIEFPSYRRWFPFTFLLMSVPLLSFVWFFFILNSVI